MKKTVALIVAVAALIGTSTVTATAKKKTPPPPPPPPPVYSWSGPYLGIAGGYGWGHSGQTDSGIPCSVFEVLSVDPSVCITALAGDGSYSVQGGLFGGTLGYNWQQYAWVFGIEGDYAWANISGSSNTCGASSGIPHACGTTLQSLGTLRGRIGYATGATGNWLPYVTGGLAFGQLNAWDALLPASGTDFRAGWTVGAGIETAFAPYWTFKVEYLYVDLGSSQMFNVVPGVPETVSFTANIIRAGINYEIH